MSEFELLLPEFQGFETLPISSDADPSERKIRVREVEARVSELARVMGQRDLARCESSSFALARILRYLIFIYRAESTDIKDDRSAVDHEWEVILSARRDAVISAMPIYYAVKAYLECVKLASPEKRRQSAVDHALFNQIRKALAQRAQWDAGGHLRGKLDELDQLLETSTDTHAQSPSDAVRAAKLTGKFGIVNASIGAAGAVLVAMIAAIVAIRQKSAGEPSVTAAVAATPSSPREVSFDAGNDAPSPRYRVAAAPYLRASGISLQAITPEGSRIVIVNNLGLYEGKAVHPTTSRNFLTQVDTRNTPASFQIVFSYPVDSVTFTRPGMEADDPRSGVTHPAWTATALDRNGVALSSHSEGLLRSFDAKAPATYTLNATGFEGITAVRFDSNPQLGGKPFAGFDAVLIDHLVLGQKHR